LLTQLEVDNANAAIRPGSYGEVQFDVDAALQSLRIPANCLLFRSEGLSAAVVDAQGKVLVKPVTVGRDFGKEVEVVQGLSAADKVILNPADSVRTGLQVRVAAGR
jgi:membrane fusion protein (multidrug efflux system)